MAAYWKNFMALHIVLHEPEIPQNTGNIARTCVATSAVLHLIHPLGFSIDEKSVRRAGLDYWDRLELREWSSLEEFFDSLKSQGTGITSAGYPENCWFVSTKAKQPYSSVRFTGDAYFLFGRESKGLPEVLMNSSPSQSLTIPMVAGNRSLNLSNSVAILAYEYWRQRDFRFTL